MEHNVGMIDRALRLVVGCALIGFAWFYPNVSFSSLGWIGLVPLATAIFGTCPIYSLLGVKTCESDSPNSCTK